MNIQKGQKALSLHEFMMLNRQRVNYKITEWAKCMCVSGAERVLTWFISL
jgi:hypothetical protein